MILKLTLENEVDEGVRGLAALELIRKDLVQLRVLYCRYNKQLKERP
jgi:hypothetical protein